VVLEGGLLNHQFGFLIEAAGVPGLYALEVFLGFLNTILVLFFVFNVNSDILH
jgi:hypothetical protein